MWNDSRHFVSTRFEDLIGVHGGGEFGVQCEKIRKIAAHVSLGLNEREIKHIAKTMIGNSYTFRKGVIGGWRSVLSDEHKDEFKKLAGNLLIELGYEKDLDW